ncbi:MAG TPA: ABC transporter substrate-binding protein [Acidimicrobiales bacterium]|nr:ABC transporter substrate-binding protein [Acidimicrobiales bacterium]
MGAIAATTLAGVGLAGCGGSTTAGAGAQPATSSSPIVICEVAATSGPFVQLGKTDELGASAWAKMVNAKGGLLGRKVKLVKENDQSKPSAAVSAMRKCVTQDHANFIFGPEETTTAVAGLPVANSLKTVTLGWQSGWNALKMSNAAKHGYAFPGIGNVFHADDQAMVNFVIARRHYTRVAVIEDNTAGGLGNATYTAGVCKGKGCQVVAKQVTTPGATDDTPEALKLLAAHPQAIVLGMTPGPDTITAIKAIRAQNPTIPIGECSGCTIPSFISAAGGPTGMKDVYLIGSPGQLASSTPKTKANQAGINDTKAYLAAMRAAGDTSANDINDASEGWDTGRELAAAIKKAGSTKEAAVRTALAHQTIVVGGLQAYYFQRTPQNYGNITRIVSAMATVKPDGSLKVYAAGG